MNRKQIKADAKCYLKSASPSPVIAGVIYVGILLLIAIVTSTLLSGDIDSETVSQIVMSADFDALTNYVSVHSPTFSQSLLDLLLQIVSLTLGVGYSVFLLNTLHAAAEYKDLFKSFRMILRVIGIYLLMIIFIFLWSLLLIIPGIIAAYRYRQAIYIMLENPDMKIGACIKASKELMRGHKWELFVLDLSFIGWALLAGIASSIGSLVGFPELSYIVFVYLFPFFGMANILYYKNLIGEYPGTTAGFTDEPLE